jgi:YVTN family beta-propeller protein
LSLLYDLGFALRRFIRDRGARSVTVIRTATNTIVATIGVDFIPVHVSVSSDGAAAYVTNAASNSVLVIGTGTQAVTTTVPVGVRPLDAATSGV